MNLNSCILYNSLCYQIQSYSQINGVDNIKYWKNHRDKKGIVVSFASELNPCLKKYVQPSIADSNYKQIVNDIGINYEGNDWNNLSNEFVSHAVIGLNAHNIVKTYQVLPYERAAHILGEGTQGSYDYNPNAYIQIYVCNGDFSEKQYFNCVLKELAEYCVFLCQLFKWNGSQIISHLEAFSNGYAKNSNNQFEHWLEFHSYSIDWFRKEVQNLLDQKTFALDKDYSNFLTKPNCLWFQQRANYNYTFLQLYLNQYNVNLLWDKTQGTYNDYLPTVGALKQWQAEWANKENLFSNYPTTSLLNKYYVEKDYLSSETLRRLSEEAIQNYRTNLSNRKEDK